jgi:hypothetical protein
MATYNFKKQAEVYLATNYDVESGMTVSETQAPNTQTSGGTPYSQSNRENKVLMAGEVVLPSSFANDHETLFEFGGLSQGVWIGMSTISNVETLVFRCGDGTAGTTASSTDRIYKALPISEISEFDDKRHTVAWEFDPPNGTAKFWIDNRLVISETTSDGTSFNVWAGSNAGGWLEGFFAVAGIADGTQGPYRTAWSGGLASDLRIYNQQTNGGNNYPLRLDVTEDITFGQTFTDKTYPQKTLHEQHKMHEASNIKKANPANFSFTIPALTENDLAVVKDLLVDYKSGTNTLNTCTIHIKLPNDNYRLDDCVLTNGTFIIEKLENLKLGIQGEASRLVKGVALPTVGRGTRSASRTHQRVDYLSVSVDSTSLTEGIYSVSVELQNDIEWTPYETVNDALSVTNAATSMYPSNFTLQKRILSGSIGQYVLSNFNSDTQQWKTGVPIVIKAGESATQGFQFDLSNCSFTNRNNVASVFTQSYDWKMNDNPTDLGSKIKFNNI